MIKFDRQNHCVYHTRYHLIFVTKYRRKILKEGMGVYLRTRLHEVNKYYPDLQILESNCDEDHIHLLLSIPPKFSVSKVVNILKSNSARDMRKKFPYLDKVYYGIDGIWSDGYFVSTVGINEDVIRRYIEYQGREDSGQAKLVL